MYKLIEVLGGDKETGRGESTVKKGEGDQNPQIKGDHQTPKWVMGRVTKGRQAVQDTKKLEDEVLAGDTRALTVLLTGAKSRPRPTRAHYLSTFP